MENKPRLAKIQIPLLKAINILCIAIIYTIPLFSG